MFADTLLKLERGHLIALACWAAASLLAGTAVLAVLAARHTQSQLLETFAKVTAGFGVAELSAVAVVWPSLAIRDLAGATAVDRLLWLESGLDVGVIAVGVTLALSTWRLSQRQGGVGAGVGVILQGAVLLALHARMVLYLSGSV